MVTFWDILENSTFKAKLLKLLFGQINKKIDFLFHHTAIES